MKNLNFLCVNGFLVVDGECKKTKAGEALVFSMANHLANHTNYIDVILFDGAAKAFYPSLKKGVKVSVSGSFKIKNFITQGGKEKTSLCLENPQLEIHERKKQKKEGSASKGSDEDSYELF